MSPKKRTLSEFLCREMIYDYLIGRLVPAERAAMDEALKEYPTLQEEIRHINGALKYCDSLTRLTPSESLYTEAARNESLLHSANQGWKTAPRSLRYGVVAILLCISSVYAVRGFYPDLDLRSFTDTVTLSRVVPDRLLEPSARVAEDAGSGEGDAPAVTKNLPATQPSPAAPQPEVATNTTTPSTGLRLTMPTLQTTPAPKIEVAVKVAEKAAEKSAVKKVADTSEASPKGGRGLVYRAYAFSNNIDDHGDQMTQKILALGGSKAGEVELGWRRKGGRYFHFTIPAKSYEEFMTYVHQFEPFRIQKDAHPRVMPAGQLRFILWLADTVGPDRGAGAPDDRLNEDKAPNGAPPMEAPPISTEGEGGSP